MKRVFAVTIMEERIGNNAGASFVSQHGRAQSKVKNIITITLAGRNRIAETKHDMRNDL